MKPDIDSAAAVVDTAAAAGQCVATSAVTFDDFESAGLGLARQESLGKAAACHRRPLLLLWRAPRALIVGRNDTRLRNFSDAADRLRAEGWPVVIRRSGGGACPVSRGTLQVAFARIASPQTTIDAAYIELIDIIRPVLISYGLNVDIGEAPRAFCPGRYDMSIDGRKVAGLSQHWRRCDGRLTATTAATLLVEDHTEEMARIVNLFYLAAGSKQRCSTSAVGTLQRFLPIRAASGTSLMEDLRNRLAKASLERLRSKPLHMAEMEKATV